MIIVKCDKLWALILIELLVLGRLYWYSAASIGTEV
jgi:hypothetical protein